MERDTVLREIQLEHMKTLRKLDEVCKKHGIQYFVIYGTLIGAVRHQGFIPWDDDLDVGMMREEFEKLRRVDPAEWGDDVVLITPEDDTEVHDRIFPRLYLKHTTIQSPRDVDQWRRRSDGKPFYTSMMCDIFMFDYAPDDMRRYRRTEKRLHGIAKRYMLTKFKTRNVRGGFRGWLHACLKNLYGNVMNLLFPKPWQVVSRKYNRISSAVKRSGRISNYNWGEAYSLAETERYFPLKTAMFEGLEVPIPRDADYLLTMGYGDYMTPPPENERVHIPFHYVDFGDGRIRRASPEVEVDKAEPGA